MSFQNTQVPPKHSLMLALIPFLHIGQTISEPKRSLGYGIHLKRKISYVDV